MKSKVTERARILKSSDKQLLVAHFKLLETRRGSALSPSRKSPDLVRFL